MICFQMRSFFILATLAFSVYADTKVFPAGVDPASCPNYPFCGAPSPADFPTPVVNGEPVAPILNTTPDQTLFWQQVIYRLTMIESNYNYIISSIVESVTALFVCMNLLFSPTV